MFCCCFCSFDCEQREKEKSEGNERSFPSRCYSPGFFVFSSVLRRCRGRARERERGKPTMSIVSSSCFLEENLSEEKEDAEAEEEEEEEKSEKETK